MNEQQISIAEIANLFPLAFEKMSGAGNDFIIVDHRQQKLPLALQPEFARRICRRKFSVGADGLILIETAREADFQWQFYNADGSVAEMCGNGARCAARFVYANGIAGKKMHFQTLAGIIEAEVLDDGETVSLRMTQPIDCRLDQTLTIEGREMAVASINTGVPHAVIFVDEKDLPVKEWGRAVRYHQMFGPAGTNANFIRLLDDRVLHVRTYERGVEDETQACGTGAVASAIIAALTGRVVSPVQIVTSGGEHLRVVFELSDGTARNVYLQGPARRIYEGRLTEESLL